MWDEYTTHPPQINVLVTALTSALTTFCVIDFNNIHMTAMTATAKVGQGLYSAKQRHYQTFEDSNT